METFGNRNDQNLKISSSYFLGKDARHVVILKGDRNNQIEKGGSVIKEEVARKYSTYFQSILHHNNGYFAQVFLSRFSGFFFINSF